MQYSFTLPADYDMAIVRRRIAEKGPLLDQLPGLAFKAYLHAGRNEPTTPGPENLYAPFYLWHTAEAMNDFLGGPAFAALARSFGWPVVRLWSVWHAELGPALRQARHAGRQITALPAHTDLADRRAHKQQMVARDIAEGALAAVTAYEPTGWTLLRLRLWAQPQPALADTDQLLYRVGHVSAPSPHEAQ